MKSANKRVSEHKCINFIVKYRNPGLLARDFLLQFSIFAQILFFMKKLSLPYLLQLKWLFFLVISVAVLSCSSDTTESATETPVQDTTTAPAASPNPKMTAMARAKQMRARIEVFTKKLFKDEYMVEKLLPEELGPKFEKIAGGMYQKYRKIEPISNEYGDNIYPVKIFKAYTFRNHEHMDTCIVGWLNSFEKSTEVVALGEDIDAVKAPPTVVAIIGNAVYMLQTSCEHFATGEASLTEQFKAAFADNEIAYLFEINCDAGKLVYSIRPE